MLGHWLHQHFADAKLPGLFGGKPLAESCADHNRLLGIDGMDVAGQVQAGDLRHDLVGDDDVVAGRVIHVHLQCIDAAIAQHRPISQRCQHVRLHLHDIHFVVNKQDALASGRDFCLICLRCLYCDFHRG